MSPVVRARLPDAYVEALAALGENQSAALRACVLLALAALGRDLTPFQAELTRGGLAGLAPDVLAAVQAAIAGRGTGVPQVYHSPPEQPELLEFGDPLMSVGIEV